LWVSIVFDKQTHRRMVRRQERKDVEPQLDPIGAHRQMQDHGCIGAGHPPSARFGKGPAGSGEIGGLGVGAAKLNQLPDLDERQQFD
jgi:hypothetical protein